MASLACVMGDMDLVRPLGLAGIPCVVVAPPGSPQTCSRFVRGVIPCHDDTPDDVLLDALLRFAATQPEPPVLCIQDDARLLMASRHRARLSGAFRLALAEPELIEDLLDKARFARLADRLGLPVPPTRRIRPDAPPDLQLPVIIKPVRRDATWDQLAAGSKAFEATTPEAFRALCRKLAAGPDLLAQQLIPGPETRIESHHAYVDATGAIAGDFTGRKIRTWPAVFGQSTALELTDAPDVAALGRQVLRTIGLRGMAKLDFKRDPDGALHLLEINPRFTLWHHLGAVAGLNLPALVHADLCGLPRPPMQPARPGATWCRPREDWHAAREAGVPIHRWLRWLRRCEANASFSPRDPLPFLQGEAWNGMVRQVRRRLA
jgi:predicted ATP-grasp superfamily ATP-dependent carboligase